MRLSLVIAIAALTSPATAAEPEGACDETFTELVKATRAVDGSAFDLADGRRVRLASVIVPSGDAPLAAKAHAELAKQVEGKVLQLAFLDEHGTDRHGHLIAQVFAHKDHLQSVFVREGWARVATRSDMKSCAKPLLALEADARQARRGLWADAFYRVRKPDELTSDIGTFQIVEGKIAAVGGGRGRLYLNFGADYRTDFTVTVSVRDRKRLAKEGVDPSTWAGKTIRIRGWLSLLNGPEIELTHAEQVELID
jgi:micrococcal nuclease